MTDQQFCLRWNNHQSTLVAVFDGLLEKGVLVDCTLAAEGQQLTAHKVVLAACSPFLETLLSRHYDKHPILILKDVKFSELKAMMDYMYRGEVNISQDQLGTFLKAAESLQIKGLSDGGSGDHNTKSLDNQNNNNNKRGYHDNGRKQQLRPTSPGSLLRDMKRSSLPAYLHNSLKPPLLVDIPDENSITRSRDGSMSPVPKKKKKQQQRDENTTPAAADIIVNNHHHKIEPQENGGLVDLHASVPSVPPSSETEQHNNNNNNNNNVSINNTSSGTVVVTPLIEKTEPKQELIEEEEDINEDSMELTLDEEDEMNQTGEAGPSHNESEFGDYYSGSQDGVDHRDGQGGEKWHNSGTIKSRCIIKQKKYGIKPLGRPRKYYPPIDDPIKFLEAASSSGLFKVNDKIITGISSFMNPNFKRDIEASENQEPPTYQQQQQPVTIIPVENGEHKPEFGCQFCGKTYKKKKHYNRHVNFECINTEPRFLCTMCTYRARRKEHLIRHLRSHIGDIMSTGDFSLLNKPKLEDNMPIWNPIHFKPQVFNTVVDNSTVQQSIAHSTV